MIPVLNIIDGAKVATIYWQTNTTKGGFFIK